TARATWYGAALPPEFDAWFAKATARSPSDRFPSAKAAVLALAEALGVPAPIQSAGPPSSLPPQRLPSVAPAKPAERSGPTLAVSKDTPPRVPLLRSSAILWAIPAAVVTLVAVSI